MMNPYDEHLAGKARPLSRKKGTRAVIVREFSRIISDRLYILLMLIFPLLTMGILWALFSAGVPRDLPIVVNDADNSHLSRRLTRMLDASPTLRVVRKVDTVDDGHKQILSGRCYALVVLPRNLEQDFLAMKAPHIVGYYNNQLLLPGSLINRDLHSVIQSLSDQLEKKLRIQINDMAVKPEQPFEPVRLETQVMFNPYLNYLYFLFSALLPAVLQILVTITTIYAFGSELKQGTAGTWFKSAGKRMRKAVIGKMLPYTGVFLILGLFFNLFLYGWVGVPIKGSLPLVLFGTVLLVLACQSIGLLLVSITANLRLALSGGLFYTVPALAFAGLTFPIMAMPSFGKIWAWILPLTHYLKIFVDQSIRGIPMVYSLLPLGGLVLFLIPGPATAIFRLKRMMTDKNYWGRL